MIDIITKRDSNIVYTTVSGTLDKEDINRLLPVLQQTIESFGKARWYYEMHDFNGWTLDAFWKDVTFSISHTFDFERIAMVGEEKWQNWMTQFMKPFSPATIQYFNSTEKEKALDWIKASS